MELLKAVEGINTVSLMEGVEVLSIKEGPGPLGVLFGGLFCAIVAIVFLAGVIYLFLSDDPEGALLIGLFFFVFIIMSILLFEDAATAPTVTYKVLIDDSVSMNEFLSYFEIVKVDGKIYTVVPR